MKIHSCQINHSTVYFIGPPLESGALPAVFYFSIAGDESLKLDPFNQPALFLQDSKLRVFSMTIPGHGEQLPKEKAMHYWAEKISHGIDPITPFIQEITHVLDHLCAHHVIENDKIAVAGLSRGGYIATLLAAYYPKIKIVLGFAPLTNLPYIKEFQDLTSSTIMQNLNLTHFTSKLVQTKIRYYVGNHDKRVGTEQVFHFIQALANLSHEKRSKEGSFELIIGNSVGYLGHGTTKEIFEEGVLWLKNMLL